MAAYVAAVADLCWVRTACALNKEIRTVQQSLGFFVCLGPQFAESCLKKQTKRPSMTSVK